MIGQPKIVYTPDGGAETTLAFGIRGPQAFEPYFEGRVHDNLATSGAVRERVTEAIDILIPFNMGHLIASDDLPSWGAFMGFALAGGQFQFFPNLNLPDYYNCVIEDTDWKPKWTAPRKYAASFVLRVLNDDRRPSGPDEILRRFYGIAG